MCDLAVHMRGARVDRFPIWTMAELLPHGVVLLRGALSLDQQVSVVESVFTHNDMHAKLAAADGSRRYWQLLMWNWPGR